MWEERLSTGRSLSKPSLKPVQVPGELIVPFPTVHQAPIEPPYIVDVIRLVGDYFDSYENPIIVTEHLSVLEHSEHEPIDL